MAFAFNSQREQRQQQQQQQLHSDLSNSKQSISKTTKSYLIPCQSNNLTPLSTSTPMNGATVDQNPVHQGDYERLLNEDRACCGTYTNDHKQLEQQQQQQEDIPEQREEQPIRTVQGDSARLTIFKPLSSAHAKPHSQLKIRTTQKYKQLTSAVNDRDSQTRDTIGTVQSSGLASKLEKAMGHQLVHYPYPLVAKCNLFLEKYSTIWGTYTIETAMGADLVEELMCHLHWQDQSKVKDTAISKRSFHLVWKFGFSAANANVTLASYPEEAILSRINCRIRMSSKCGLYKLLWLNRSPHAPDDLQMHAILPKSYLLHPMSDEFKREIRRPGSTWILKPSNSSQGVGLKLYRSSGDLKEFAALVQEHFKNFNAGDILVQKYIDDPLLVDRRKFNLRVFLLVVPHQEKNTLFAFYHPGYVRLTCRRYEKDSEMLTVHLTNQVMQRRDPRFEQVKEATTWSPSELNCYFNKRQDELGIGQDWVHSSLHPRIKAILGYIVSLMNSSEIRGRRCFEIFGCDFLIDSRMQVWLIDINSGPSLTTNTEVLKNVIPGVIQEAVGLALEVMYKSQKFKFIYPLVFQNNYSLIFDGQTSSSLY